MKKMKSIFLAVFLIAGTKIFAQGYPVIDIQSITGGIMRLYTMYDEVNSMITQVQQGYEQIQRAVEAAKNWEMDWSNWDGSWDSSSLSSTWKSLDFRDEISGTLSQFQAMQNHILEIEKTFDEKKLTFKNGEGFTITELLGFKHDAVIDGIKGEGFSWKENLKKAWGEVLNATKDDLAEYKKMCAITNYMTDWERAIWDRTHKESPEQYVVAKAKEDEIKKKLRKAVAKAEDEAQELKSTHNTMVSSNLMKEILSKSEQTEPELLQKIAMLLNNMTNILNEMDLEIQSFHGNFAQMYNDMLDSQGKFIGRDSSGNVALFDEEKMSTNYEEAAAYSNNNNF